MQSFKRSMLKLAALLVVVMVLCGLGLTPGAAQAAGPLTSDACATVGTTTTCDLYAKTGTVVLPGVADPVTIWGYSATDGGAATLPGPVLIANEGDTVTVNLHNGLGEQTSLLFSGIDMAPDLGGAAPGTSKSYSFNAFAPGTYLYEAGLLDNAQHQVAMGLYGVLIVRSATANQAYASASTAYNDEALIVLSEIDLNLNGSTSPAAFDMRNYHPTYGSVNGKVSPQTRTPVDPHDRLPKVLLRYANAGVQPHSMGVFGVATRRDRVRRQRPPVPARGSSPKA